LFWQDTYVYSITKFDNSTRICIARIAVFFRNCYSLLLVRSKGPSYRPDAIWQRDANFQCSMTFNFTIFLCFSNIRNHLSNFSYLVYISCKICIRGRSFFLKTENPRHVVESRSVCVDLYKCILDNDHLQLNLSCN
jgi:hypothetical protein